LRDERTCQPRRIGNNLSARPGCANIEIYCGG
jgi:hypothetical protein